MSFGDLNVKNEYRSLIDCMSKDFYIPILKESVKYDRAVGFFSSSSLIVISKGLMDFVNNGGYMRLIASPKLSDEDITAIRSGYEKRVDIVKKALIRELYEPSDFISSQRLNLLANLIADGKLDLKIALTENDNKYGMYHEKMGVFIDQEGNKIAFSGSMNETATAMETNYEAIDVYCSWKNNENMDRVNGKISAFESIWAGVEPNVTTWDFPDIKEEILIRYKKEPVDYSAIHNEPESDIDDFKIMTNNNPQGARIPCGFRLHEFQKEAISKWEDYGHKGIFDMATGTGKTYTGLGAIASLSVKLRDRLAVIISCPYQHLVEQWVEDIVKFNMKPIIGYSASLQKNWKQLLEDAVRDQKLHVKNREFFLFITTNATFTSEFVQRQINKIKGDILLVVDEAHNFGAENLRRLLSEKFNYRLALSATLDRHGDSEGTEALYNYFGNKCIEYSLDRAIEEGKLTKYKYYPRIVTLTENERQVYDELSRQIQKCLVKSKTGQLKLSEKGKKLALKRARIVAGAINKIALLKQEIMPYVHDKHILIYCGATKILEQDQDFTAIDDDDIRQIDFVTDILGNELEMKVSQFTSKEDVEEREILKREFAKGDNLQALIAIKCLDEGVNIPKIKVAFILASTTNPKEYIQRRGRVLRLSEGKEFAEIYDFITLPRDLDEVSSLTEDQMKRELTLVKNELYRAEEFARIAINGVEANLIIEDIREAYDLQNYVIDYEGDYNYGD